MFVDEYCHSDCNMAFPNAEALHACRDGRWKNLLNVLSLDIQPAPYFHEWKYQPWWPDKLLRLWKNG